MRWLLKLFTPKMFVAMCSLAFFGLLMATALHADDVLNPVSLTAQAVNNLIGIATQSQSIGGFSHTVVAIVIGLMLSPVKQNILEHYVMPFIPWYAKAIVPLVLGSILSAIGMALAKKMGIEPSDALAAAAAMTGGAYAFNASALAVTSPLPDKDKPAAPEVKNG